MLESIIGQDILPRGSGIVTRAPIELRLTRIRKDERPYVILMMKPEEKIYDMSDVTSKILQI